MVAFILSAISAYGWVILTAAICGAIFAACAALFRANRALSAIFFPALAFMPLFLWQMIKNPRDFLHVLWLVLTLPFATALGIVQGIGRAFISPFQSGSRPQERPQSTDRLPQMKN